MQVVTERLPNAVAKISVTIDHDEVVKAMDRAFRRVVSQYNVPGFRRGKVPRHIFERMVGRHVIWNAAAEELVDSRYTGALSEAGIEPVAEPNIQIESAIGEEDLFSFVIEVEAKPTIDLEDYSQYRTEPLPVTEVTDERLAAEMEAVAKSQGQLVPADDEPVAMGNQVVLDLKGYLEEPDEDDDGLFAEDEDYTVQIGSGATVEGLEDQLVGLKVGEPATCRLTYPEEHPDVDLAGKPVRFEITVKQNKRLDVPAIDDELAKTLNFESLEDLRQEVSSRLAEQLAIGAKEERIRFILGKLKEHVEFDVPSKLVDMAVRQRLQEVQNSLARMDITIEQYLETRQMTLQALEEELREPAVETVKDQLILEAVAKREGFTATDEEVMAAIQMVANVYRQPLANVVQLFRQQGEYEQVRGTLISGKARDFLATPPGDDEAADEQEDASV